MHRSWVALIERESIVVRKYFQEASMHLGSVDVELSPALLDAAREAAAREGLSTAQWIAKLVAAHLARSTPAGNETPAPAAADERDAFLRAMNKRSTLPPTPKDAYR